MVTVLTRDAEEAVFVDPEEEAELFDAIREAEHGETISWEALQARLTPLK